MKYCHVGILSYSGALCGATTFSITTLSIMTLIINDIQHRCIQYNDTSHK